jgi:hypothetical protein
MKRLFKEPLFMMFIGFFVFATLASLTTIVNGDYGITDSFIPIILGAAVFADRMAKVNALHDAKEIAEGVTIKHWPRFILRAITAFAMSFLLLGEFTWDVVWLSLLQGYLFWIDFDYYLNIARDKHPLYLSTWYKTSWLDLLFNGNVPLWMATKIIFVITSILLLLL